MRNLIMILLFAFQVFAAGAQTDTARNIFTEEQFLAVLSQFHPVAKQANINVRIAEAEITSARGAFDPVFTIDNARKEFDGSFYYDERQTQIKIPTWYGIDLFAGKEDITGGRLNPADTRGEVTYLGISVPLLQNLVMDKRRAALQQAKVAREMSEVQRRNMLNDLRAESLKTYWNWWKQFELLQVINSAVKTAEMRFAMVKNAYLLGERPAIDTVEAYTQVQSLVIRRTETLAELMKARYELSAYLWTSQGAQYDLPESVVPGEWKQQPDINLDSLLISINNHPDLQEFNYKLDMLRIEQRLKFQQLLPEVNVKYNQLGGDWSKTTNSPWFDNNYRFGVVVSVPLRLAEGRGEYRKAKLKTERTRVEQSDKQVQIMTRIKRYFTDFRQTTQELALQTQFIRNVEALQAGEETRFRNGESSLFLVNARELRTIEAQEKLISIRAENRKSVINVRWAAGLLAN